MTSLRSALAKVGIPADQPFSFRGDLQRAPGSLARVIRATQVPGPFQPVSDIKRADQRWTDEIQGVAGDGGFWYFSSNAAQKKPLSRDKALYAFPAGSQLKDGQWSRALPYWQVPVPFAVDEDDHHWGQVTLHQGRLYVSHFWQGGPDAHGTNVAVFQTNGGNPAFERWIKVGAIDGRRPEFQAINPWDGNLYTCFGGDEPVARFHIHDPANGDWLGIDLVLRGALPTNVQGACFDGNGHLYVAVDRPYYDQAYGGQYKPIQIYSALTGAYLGFVPVLALDDDQELEGICIVPVGWADGRQAQLHAVLLENSTAEVDDIFFKSFAASDSAAMT